MVVEMEHFSPKEKPNNNTLLPCIPLIDLSNPDSKNLIVKACEEFGFFKLINHGVPTVLITRLEFEATKFFSLPASQKEKAGPPNPFGYGNKMIGLNGDIGWVEYLLMKANSEFDYEKFSSISGQDPQNFRQALNDYLGAVREMTCKVLELMAEGLRILPKDVFSRLVMDKESDSLFRLNHYPPCPCPEEEEEGLRGGLRMNLVGFGEHTDPQIISVLRSNNTSGLEISLQDATWLSVPPDHTSFFINVGDSMQVMTNGRFRSVRHRVVTNTVKSRVSMIYFGGPPMSEKIAPLPSLTGGDDKTCLYKEFTWFEYKNSAYKSKLAHNRLHLFEKIVAEVIIIINILYVLS